MASKWESLGKTKMFPKKKTKTNKNIFLASPLSYMENGMQKFRIRRDEVDVTG